MPEYQNVTVRRDGKLVTERRELPPFMDVRVTLEDGEFFDTSLRGNIDEIRAYFFQAGGITDHGSTSEKEIVRRIVKVEPLVPTPA